jgi:predicted XRE-type DNA-binding protein
MAKKRIEVEPATGNVFADLGYADAKERTLKVELALEVNRTLKQRQLTQARAAELLGIVQPHVSDLARYCLNRFSVERLMQFLTQLGKDVEIRIATQPARRSRPGVRVSHVAVEVAERVMREDRKVLRKLAKS